MARQPAPYTYNVETLAALSGWPANRIHQDVSRNDLDISKLHEAAIWLAANALPQVRAEMARRLVAPILGSRRQRDDTLYEKAGDYDLMVEIYKRDRSARDARSGKIKKRKRSG